MQEAVFFVLSQERERRSLL
uniref:Uncharacterized protein n=1 Tax=Arundo donax TaxID=35708 RepID=A0A0A9C388_ARUDO